MKTRVIKYDKSGNKVVNAFLELEPVAENVFKAFYQPADYADRRKTCLRSCSVSMRCTSLSETLPVCILNVMKTASVWPKDAVHGYRTLWKVPPTMIIYYCLKYGCSRCSVWIPHHYGSPAKLRRIAVKRRIGCVRRSEIGKNQAREGTWWNAWWAETQVPCRWKDSAGTLPWTYETWWIWDSYKNERDICKIRQDAW